MKRFFLFYLILFSGLLMPRFILAVCPVCTIAIGAGVGLCRWLGIDDLISGTWIGGLVVSMIFWALNWIENKKQIQSKAAPVIVSIIFYLIVVVPLYWMDIIGHPLNKFLGVDKLIFGIGAGSVAFLLSVWLDKFLKNKNQGKALFPFQKVALPIIFLLILSLIFSLIC